MFYNYCVRIDRKVRELKILDCECFVWKGLNGICIGKYIVVVVLFLVKFREMCIILILKGCIYIF